MVGDYRLAMETNEQGLVRTVQVSFRRRDKREPAEEKRKPLVTNIAVQRLSLLQAVGEDHPTGE